MNLTCDSFKAQGCATELFTVIRIYGSTIGPQYKADYAESLLEF